MDLPDHFDATVAKHEKDLTEFVREQTGRDDLVVEYDRRPLLLSTEKRKWPDDFRGFGSNVRPKRQT
jgi:hypothetical protein